MRSKNDIFSTKPSDKDEPGYSKTKKAKKTFYNGRWYDSVLEARVARALDSMGIAFDHHGQVFLDDRFPFGKYTPDFRLENQGVYVEVAWAFDQRHRGNITTLCELLDSRDGNCKVVFIDTNGDSMWCYMKDGRLVTESGKVWKTTGNIFVAAEHPGTKHV